ncbi:phosphoribosylglycinamide formyltransferase [Thermovirga lienii DSM 17291]|jgi:phosphoribosylglycinamide formyltransferase-1|uniref:Phosphoribosylglycinamide formyltransferase n=1 Tax=Thermovirga lienii (strain ATCC BAA-1197 / DSM 17291 / Cas60314) TaxID=580340 RepID=G7V599_THELD|nr:phosphoribosylglycinamide formyltransferase [Thermovirga lienii]AER66882.1 phosphoribosylglycinamide formyltransferase [Thermovirga lienii DSM 17291]MDN5318099.1 phosphoribosylglycinamide formyltransferase 1 [Thermovirga sp.]MDN5367310.1 phosphoribosylglycinamide formyltransferase 1 [Thermovirga sp.]HCD71955.1 phosphoribosylglycinamide formyltransferase [Thermovirga lienii]
MTSVAVLISGRGTNMETIVKNCQAGKIPATVAFVGSSKKNAEGLKKAKNLGIPTVVLPYQEGVETAEKTLLEELKNHHVEWIILAGFMRILSPKVVRSYPNRIVNIHPSLLPSFPGVDAIRQAFEYGVKVTGVTVHLVDEEVDHGPILAQMPVRISPYDTLETLEEKIHRVEHYLYTEVLKDLFTNGQSATRMRRDV